MTYVLSALLFMSIGAAIDISDRSHRHQQFTENLKSTNSQRAAQGLPALDFCSEAYWHDHGWAQKQSECAPRIRRFEAGDSTALNPQGYVLSRTVAVVPDSVQRAFDDTLKVREARKWSPSE